MPESPVKPPENKFEPGSKTLNDRVSEVGRKIVVPVADLFTQKKTCHRFMIPFDVQTPQEKLNPLKPGERVITINVEPKMAFVPCVGAACALWNAQEKECYDVTEKKASVRTATILETMDAYQRLHTREG